MCVCAHLYIHGASTSHLLWIIDLLNLGRMSFVCRKAAAAAGRYLTVCFKRYMYGLPGGGDQPSGKCRRSVQVQVYTDLMVPKESFATSESLIHKKAFSSMYCCLKVLCVSPRSPNVLSAHVNIIQYETAVKQGLRRRITTTFDINYNYTWLYARQAAVQIDKHWSNHKG